MNYVISIINPEGTAIMTDICRQLKLNVSSLIFGHGTASKKTLDLLGIESRDRRIFMTVAGDEDTEKLIAYQRSRLYIDTPGNGITVALPIKSVGGRKTLTYLNKGVNEEKKMPDLNYDCELIIAIANEGYTDTVMDAARSAGARGGTVIHAKGTGGKNAEKFYNVSIADEKEIILIVASTSDKAEIMKAILTNAGPGSEAGAITFSLPVSKTAGFRMGDGKYSEESL